MGGKGYTTSWGPCVLSVKEEKKSTCKFIFEMSHDFIILEPDSHWVVCVVRVVQKDPKDKTF